MKIMFVCIANVWRSQVAEWIYNFYSKNIKAISCAWAEAKKEKYNSKPDSEIVEILLQNWINISEQKINYITDFNKEELNNIKKVIFLYNPDNKSNINKDCLIHWMSVYEYFLNKKNVEIIINEINDPYWLWINDKINIYNEINIFVKSLL